MKVLSGLLPTFHSDGIWFHGEPVRFRERDFKFCRYTVFAEDNSFQYLPFVSIFLMFSRHIRKHLPDVSELLEEFHFEEYADILLKDLSTGNRKKGFSDHCFCLKPELLLLDEPVNGLGF